MVARSTVMSTMEPSDSGNAVIQKEGSPRDESLMTSSDRESSRVSSPSSSDCNNAADDVLQEEGNSTSATRQRSLSDIPNATPVEALLVLACSSEERISPCSEPPSGQHEKTKASHFLAPPDQAIYTYEALEGSLKANKDTDRKSNLNRTTLYDPIPGSQAESLQLGSETHSSNDVEESDEPPKVISLKSTSRQGSTKSNKGSNLRRGKWTVEEEAYVARVIQDFNSGFLDAPAGTTLRTYLSEKLKCDPMRITKKFTGEACIGKRVFHPAVRSPSNATAIDRAQAELDALERRWRRRLEMQQRESAKKAAASAAVAAAASSGRSHVLEHSSSAQDIPCNPVAQTASWLDRAKSALKDPPQDSSIFEQAADLQHQMHEVERLICEGPTIQQTSADLPHMLEGPLEDSLYPEEEPADKRLRTAEDAEALVGFIRSVQASAASGEEF